MIRRALLLAVAAMAMLAGPVAAQYDGTSAETTVTEDEIVVSAEGFIANATVTYQVDYEPFGDENALGFVGGYEGEIAFAMNVAAPMEIVQTGSTTADANGAVNFAVDNRGEGRYEITMTDGVNTVTAMAVVGEAGAGDAGTDADAGAGTTGSLPRTGSDSSMGLAQFGFAAVALGGVAVYAAKRRKAKAFA